MNIVILDGFTANPGDLNWDGLSELGSLIVYDRTRPDETVQRAKDAEIILTNKTVISEEVMSKLPKLRYIGLLSTGTNVVDLKAAQRRGITVTNVPAYSSDSVAQLVFALLLELCMKTSLHNKAVHDGEWVRCDDFSFTKAPIAELAGKTMGIIGYGSIGRKVAQIALAMGMKVAVYSRTKKDDFITDDIRWLSLSDLLKQSDVVTLHCPLTDETKGMINKEAVDSMKSTAYLINTARGPILDEAAVADALNSDRIAGAGVDVLSTEPPAPENPLLTAKNCIITPHIAWATKEARVRLIAIATKNVKAFIEGKSVNVVSTGGQP
jgi:glycerate dehydrogenase